MQAGAEMKMKYKGFPLPPGLWFAIICVGIVGFFVMLKPADQLDDKREPRQTIKEAAASAQMQSASKKSVVKEAVTGDAPLISRVDFYGDKLSENKFDEGMITIAGSGSARWAYVLVQFARPVDFFTSTITFLAKGGGQVHAMEVGLTDADRRTTARDEYINLAVSDEYQKMSIRGKDIQSISMNKGKVNALKIGWNAKDAGDAVQDLSLSIKDLVCVSNEEYLDAEEKTAEKQSLLGVEVAAEPVVESKPVAVPKS